MKFYLDSVIHPDLVMVLPDVCNPDIRKNATHMDLGDKQSDYHTGKVVKVGENLKKSGYPFQEGQWVHYKPVGGWKVHLERKPGNRLEKENEDYHLIMTADYILFKL